MYINSKTIKLSFFQESMKSNLFCNFSYDLIFVLQTNPSNSWLPGYHKMCGVKQITANTPIRRNANIKISSETSVMPSLDVGLPIKCILPFRSKQLNQLLIDGSITRDKMRFGILSLKIHNCRKIILAEISAIK